MVTIALGYNPSATVQATAYTQDRTDWVTVDPLKLREAIQKSMGTNTALWPTYMPTNLEQAGVANYGTWQSRIDVATTRVSYRHYRPCPGDKNAFGLLLPSNDKSVNVLRMPFKAFELIAFEPIVQDASDPSALTTYIGVHIGSFGAHEYPDGSLDTTIIYKIRSYHQAAVLPPVAAGTPDMSNLAGYIVLGVNGLTE
jgi:hypothetical protein